MENINILILENGFVRLTAKKGYSLFSKNLLRVVSEAVVKEKQLNEFKAIAL